MSILNIFSIRKIAVKKIQGQKCQTKKNKNNPNLLKKKKKLWLYFIFIFHKLLLYLLNLHMNGYKM